MDLFSSTSDSSDALSTLQPHLLYKSHASRVNDAIRIVGLYEKGEEPSKQSLDLLTDILNELDQSYQVRGVDFSRAQLNILLRAHQQGFPIEFETLGPYLADYTQSNGKVVANDLIPEDKIGLSLAQAIRPFLSSARVISLYDDYNCQKSNERERSKILEFTPQLTQNFRNSLVRLLKKASVIPTTAVDGKDFLLIPESSKATDAEQLILRLSERGLVVQHGNEVRFVNDKAENPLYRNITLRTKQGRWLCEALDAAAFLKPENQEITHLIALPSYMKTQQDKVWEILRTLDIPATNYHNIFYDPTITPQDAATIITEAFRVAEILAGA